MVSALHGSSSCRRQCRPRRCQATALRNQALLRLAAGLATSDGLPSAIASSRLRIFISVSLLANGGHRCLARLPNETRLNRPRAEGVQARSPLDHTRRREDGFSIIGGVESCTPISSLTPKLIKGWGQQATGNTGGSGHRMGQRKASRLGKGLRVAFPQPFRVLSMWNETAGLTRLEQPRCSIASAVSSAVSLTNSAGLRLARGDRRASAAVGRACVLWR